MPFKRISKNKYQSPTGKKMSKKQVQAYYASKKGKKRRKK